MKRHYFSFLIVLGVFVFFAAACGSTSVVETPPTVEATVVTATAVPEEPVFTQIPEQLTASDLYCPKGNMSTDWCVCSTIGSGEGPIAALRRESGSEPHEMGGIFGQVIEILVYTDGVPSHIEVYDWEKLLTEFETTLQPGDVVCDAFRPTISLIHTDLEVIDYRDLP